MAPPVRLVHYDARWRQEFEQTRSNVLQACQGWVTAVEHTGSTAVEGLIARPVIDCVAGVLDAEDLGAAKSYLEGLGYRPRTLPIWADDDGFLMTKPRYGERTHQVFLVTCDGLLWRRMIAVRDWMRSHPEDALRFQDAKVHRWKCCEGDPVAYAQGKAVFFAHLEDQIGMANRA